MKPARAHLPDDLTGDLFAQPPPRPARDLTKEERLERAFQAVKEEAYRNGFHVCEHCSSKTSLYSRYISGAMAFALLKMRQKELAGERWVQSTEHCADLGFSAANSNFSLLGLWGLIEPYDPRNPDHTGLGHDHYKPEGDSRVPKEGLYRLTPTGREFADGHLRLPQYIFTLQGRILGSNCDPVFLAEYEAISGAPHRHANKWVGIRDCSNKKFDLTKVLAATVGAGARNFHPVLKNVVLPATPTEGGQ